MVYQRFSFFPNIHCLVFVIFRVCLALQLSVTNFVCGGVYGAAGKDDAQTEKENTVDDMQHEEKSECILKGFHLPNLFILPAHSLKECINYPTLFWYCSRKGLRWGRKGKGHFRSNDG
jgi:hypothetical protein